MIRDLWRMRGPALFVKNATDDLLETGCLIVELPGRLRTGFALAFKRVLDERDVCRLRQMDAAVAKDQKPAQTVARHGLPSGVTIGMNVARSLATSPELEDEVLWIDGIARESWRHWEVFLHALARERSLSPLTSPYMIALSAPPGLAQPREGISLRRWTGELRRADTALYVAEAMIGRPPSQIDLRILEAIVTEIAGWNLELADRLAELDTETLLDPLLWLKSQGTQAFAHQSEDWHGHAFTCSLELARRGETAALRRRIWLAHLATVFPLLEEIRLALAERYRQKLARHLPSKTPWGDTVDEVEDLEFGHMLHLLRGCVEADSLALLQRCKRMRDQLAHRRPVAPEDLNQLVRSDLWSISA